MEDNILDAEFLENAGIIFSPENLNKIEAAYGPDMVSALKDMLYRIENGRNRPSGSNKIVNGFMNWFNAYVAATYFGDAVITEIASATSCSIASTASLVNPAKGTAFNLALAGVTTTFTVSQMPIWCTQNLQGDKFRNTNSDFNSDSLVFGISNATAQNSDTTAAQAPSVQGQFKTDAGWVGVTTYIDSHGNYRVKQEVLVAMSGITTGSIDYYTEGS